MDPTALGRYLRESREAKELTLEDAVQSLRIRREVFESFEQGNFQVADSQVRIRGMLRNYARFLSLEEDRVLQYYEAALSEKRRIRRRFGRSDARPEPIAPKSITDTPPALPAVVVGARRRFDFAGFLRNIMMILVSIASITVIIFVIYNLLDLNSVLANATTMPTEILSSGTATPSNTPSITPSTLVATSSPDSFARGILNVQILLELTQRSYVRLIVDNNEIFAGMMEPGESMRLEGSDSVFISAGNAAALDIVYNDVEQELFGGRGQQVDLLFTNTGVEIDFGEGSAAFTETATQAIILVTPTSLLGEATQEIVIPTTSVSLESSPTVLISAESSPTPFLAESSVNTTEQNPTTDTGTTPSSVTLQASPTQIVNSPTATQTETATATATSIVLLPPRASSADATPAKP